LHRCLDMLDQKVMGSIIPILVKMNLTPNEITVLRFLVLIPPSAFLFTLNNYFLNIIALALFQLFAFLDIVDGKIAVIRGMQTRLGEILDPIVDYIGHNFVFLGIAIAVLGSNGVFHIGSYSILIPIQYLLLCVILTIVGFSTPLIFSMIPPTRFFMFQDLHTLHETYFPEKRIKSNGEPTKVWISKNIICYYHFPFNILFKVGPILAICVLLNVLFISILIFSIMLNVRALTLFYYFFKIYEKGT